jgi:ribosome-associated protein
VKSAEGTVQGAPRPAAVRQDDPSDGLLTTILTALDDGKAEDVVTIDLLGKSSIADTMVVAAGRSDRHVKAIADRVVRALKDGGHGRAAVEGEESGDWILIDAGNVILHVFRPEVRAFLKSLQTEDASEGIGLMREYDPVSAILSRTGENDQASRLLLTGENGLENAQALIDYDWQTAGPMNYDDSGPAASVLQASKRVHVSTIDEERELTIDGNHVRIPNSTVYKGVIVNFTRNPLRRFDLTAGVGPDEDLAAATGPPVASVSGIWSAGSLYLHGALFTRRRRNC